MKRTFTACVTALKQAVEQDTEGAEFDQAFDGGEFSGPAHANMLEREAQAILADHGYDSMEELVLEAAERGLSLRWVYCELGELGALCA